jgi:hypothetical protein
LEREEKCDQRKNKDSMTDEYLSIEQLTLRIPLSKRTLELEIASGRLLEGVHFRRPTGPRGKRIFFMSAIEKWLKGQDFDLRRQQLVGKTS